MKKLLIMLPLVLLLFSCKEEDPPIFGKANVETTIANDANPNGICTITYVTNYGETPKTVSVSYGTNLSSDYLPELSDGNGHVFSGWYYNDVQISAGYLVTSNITLTAKWDE